WSRPAECKVATDFRDCVIRNEQGVGTSGIRRHRAELIMPQPDRRPALQEVRDAAHDLLNPLALSGDELEVHQHDLAIVLKCHASPRSRRTIGWSGRSIIRSLKAGLSSPRNDACGNTGAGAYKIIEYEGPPIEPVFPQESFLELLKLAFKNRMIDRWPTQRP